MWSQNSFFLYFVISINDFTVKERKKENRRQRKKKKERKKEKRIDRYMKQIL